MIWQKYIFSEMNVEDNYDNSDNILVHNVFYAEHDVSSIVLTIDDTIVIRFGAVVRQYEKEKESRLHVEKLGRITGMMSQWEQVRLMCQ